MFATELIMINFVSLEIARNFWFYRNFKLPCAPGHVIKQQFQE